MDDKRIRQIVKEELARSTTRKQFGMQDVPFHTHNGKDSPNVNQASIKPNIRSMGSITFSRTTRYYLDVTFNPTAIQFYGVAVDDSLYTFTLDEAVNASAGAVYTNNGETFVLTANVGSGDSTMNASGTGDPASSGDLDKVSGGGEIVIEYSSFAAPGTPTIRAFAVGNAQLGPSYYFQPETVSSVRTGGPLQQVIQSCSSTVTGASGTRVFVNEGNLVRIQYPSSSTIVATATVVGFANNSVVIDVEVASGWSIIGNYVVT